MRIEQKHPGHPTHDAAARTHLRWFSFHAPARVVRILDPMYHALHWLLTRLLWQSIVVSLAGGALLSYVTTGTPGLADPRTWPPIRLALLSPVASAFVLLAFGDLYLVAYLVHHEAHPRIQVGSRQVGRVRDVDLHDVLLKLGPNVSPAFFLPPHLDAMRKRLRHARLAGGGGLLLTGMPGVGKTRLALEGLRLEIPDDLLLVWQQGDDVGPVLDGLHGRQVGVLLDDLPELASTPEDARVLIGALHHLQQIAKRVIVVATLRSSTVNAAAGGASGSGERHSGDTASRRSSHDSQSDAERHDALVRALPHRTARAAPVAREEEPDRQIVPHRFATLARTFGAPLEITPFRPQSRAWMGFLAFISTVARQDPTLHLSPATFDGTPGSVFLGLDERVRELASPDFPLVAHVILRSLALLRAAHITPWTTDRVRAVTQAVFDEQVDAATWDQALAFLIADGWLTASTRGTMGTIVRVPTDAYLTDCVPRAGYPVPPRRIANDFPALAQHLLNPPHDYDALLALGDALRLVEGGSSQDQQARVALALDLIAAAQRLVTKAEKPDQWARGQAQLGRAYSAPVVGNAAVRRQHQTAAIAAFTEALEVWTADRYPVEHATVLADLGNVYQDRDEGDAGEDIERAIACYQEALDVFTPETFPAEFVDVQERLAAAFASLEETPAHLAGAIAALEASTHVIRRETAPRQWATTQARIGDLQLQRGRWDVAGFDAAVGAYTASLEVVTEDTDALRWGIINNDLGAAYLRRRRGDQRANLDAAIACFRKALGVLVPTRNETRSTWAMATVNLALGLLWYQWDITSARQEEAVALLGTALAQVSPDADPTIWADLCSAAGAAYRVCAAGDPVENRTRARRYLVAAQAIQQREDDEEGLAITSVRLAELFTDEADLARRAGHLTRCRRKREHARDAYAVALDFFTEQSAPIMHREVMAAVAQLDRSRC